MENARLTGRLFDMVLSSTATGFGFGLGAFLLDRFRRAYVSPTPSVTVGQLSDAAVELDVSGGGDYVREYVAESSDFDPRSFRTINVGENDSGRVTIGCPTGHWDDDQGQCEVGTRAYAILHPRENRVEEFRIGKRNRWKVGHRNPRFHTV